MTDPTPDPTATPSTGPSLPVLLLTRVVVPIAFVVLAVGCAGAMFAMKPSAARGEVTEAPTRVDVVRVSAGTTRAHIQANGIVEPVQRVTVVPQISAEVRWIADAVVPGGRLDAGETFARLDARDYQLQVEAARASVRSAALELDLEKGRGAIAQKEWALLNPGRDPADAPLALRGPQLETARQALASAEANLGQAEVLLGRTRLSAPFDALVLEESLEVGQVVAPGAPVATLIGTDAYRVKVSLPVSELGALVLPDGERVGSPATVRHELGSGTTVVREGAVTQLLAQLDPQTRTAQVLVTIPDPLEGEGLPLLPGAYVHVEMEGRALDDVVRVPRTALHDGHRVWTVEGTEGDGILRARTVEVGWKEGDDVLVTQGLDHGDRVVVSPLAIPLDGMTVEVLTTTDLAVDAR